ncbi:hypothetical protein MUK42_09305, partial [Musa troglodytarum]
DLNGPYLGLLHLPLGHYQGEHPVLHGGLHLVGLRILRQPEPPVEPAAAPLRAVPLALLLVINRIPAMLAAYGEDPAVLHLHLQVPLSDPREVGLEDMRLRGLLPVHADVVCTGIIRGKATECIEDVAVTTQHVVDESHIRCCRTSSRCPLLRLEAEVCSKLWCVK